MNTGADEGTEEWHGCCLIEGRWSMFMNVAVSDGVAKPNHISNTCTESNQVYAKYDFMELSYKVIVEFV